MEREKEMEERGKSEKILVPVPILPQVLMQVPDRYYKIVLGVAVLDVNIGVKYI